MEFPIEIVKVVKKGDYDYALVKDHPNATSNGYVLYHRVVMENYLGRLLYSDEVVHHKDGNKHNNTIDNLEVLSNKEHSTLHAKRGRTYVELVCKNCGKVFYREKRQIKKGRDAFCSRRCNGDYQRKHNWKPICE